MVERKAVRLVELRFRISAKLYHGVRGLVHAGLLREDAMRAAMELAVAEAAVERLALDDEGAPLAPPVVPLVLPVEVAVREETWRWLEYRAHLSALSLEQACASVLEELVRREVAPGLDVWAARAA